MSNGSEGKDVLSSLPRSRPERRSTKRDGARASKPKAKPTPKPAAASKPKAKPKVGQATRPSAATRRARAETAKSPKAEQVAPADRDIVTTTVQAAGELARIGITLGTQIVREATRRLPKP
jgi:hypothetical protein